MKQRFIVNTSWLRLYASDLPGDFIHLSTNQIAVFFTNTGNDIARDSPCLLFRHWVVACGKQGIGPLQIKFLIPVHRPHPQAAWSRCGPIIRLLMTSQTRKRQFASAMQPRFQADMLLSAAIRPLLLQNAPAVDHL